MKFPVTNRLRSLELGTPRAMRVWLNELVLTDQKRATAGSIGDYADNEKEFVGELLTLVNNDNIGSGTL